MLAVLRDLTDFAHRSILAVRCPKTHSRSCRAPEFRKLAVHLGHISGQRQSTPMQRAYYSFNATCITAVRHGTAPAAALDRPHRWRAGGARPTWCGGGGLRGVSRCTPMKEPYRPCFYAALWL
jgi:hypothetical protein